MSCRGGMVVPWKIPWLSRSGSIMPLPTIKKIPEEKNWFMGCVVSPWRNNFAKSKQKHNAPSHNNDNSKNGVWVAWWQPEELPWLSRRRRIMHPSHNNDYSEKMVWVGVVVPRRNTLALSKQKHNALSHKNDNSGKKWCRGGMVTPWRNTLTNSKQKHNAPFPQ